MQWIARASRAHVIIAFTALIAFLSTFAYLQSLDKKIAVAQISHDIVAGAVITPHDVKFVDVSYDSIIQESIVTERSLRNNNLVARVDLSGSDLLTTTNTVRRSSKTGLQSLSIGIESDRANGGDIKKKDHIDIWQTGENARLIAQGVPVRNVILPNKRLGISTSKTLTLVLAVTPTQAHDLSTVIGSQDMMVVLSTGAPSEALMDQENAEPDPSSFESFNDPTTTTSTGE